MTISYIGQRSSMKIKLCDEAKSMMTAQIAGTPIKTDDPKNDFFYSSSRWDTYEPIRHSTLIAT